MSASSDGEHLYILLLDINLGEGFFPGGESVLIDLRVEDVVGSREVAFCLNSNRRTRVRKVQMA